MSVIQKYSEIPKDFQFCDYFGDKPLVLGHITKDAAAISVFGAVLGFVAFSMGGFPAAALTVYLVVNDVLYAKKGLGDREDPIDTTATEVDESQNPVFAHTPMGVPAVTEFQPIAAAPSMSHLNGSDSIAPETLQRIWEITHNQR